MTGKLRPAVQSVPQFGKRARIAIAVMASDSRIKSAMPVFKELYATARHIENAPVAS
jgi:hypothetical protein